MDPFGQLYRRWRTASGNVKTRTCGTLSSQSRSKSPSASSTRRQSVSAHQSQWMSMFSAFSTKAVLDSFSVPAPYKRLPNSSYRISHFS